MNYYKLTTGPTTEFIAIKDNKEVLIVEHSQIETPISGIISVKRATIDESCANEFVNDLCMYADAAQSISAIDFVTQYNNAIEAMGNQSDLFNESV